MSIFEQDETLCDRELNTCRSRYKCLRYMQTEGTNNWVANYWQEFGKLCPHFKPIPKLKVKPHANTKTDKSD